MLRLLIIAAMLLPATLARADVTAPDGRIIECFCTDTYGQRRELGDIICLSVGDRSYMAKCIMAQNVPFWRDQKMGCLSSNLNMTPRPTLVATLFAKSIDRFKVTD